MKHEILAHNLVAMETAAFVDAVRGDFGLEITDVEKATSGWSSQVYRATLEGKMVFIKINKDPHIFPVEVLGYDILKQQGVPSPHVISYQENPPTIGHPTIILSAAEGVEMNQADFSPEQKDSVYEQMGEILRKINEVKLEGFGALKAQDGKLRGRFDSWTGYWMAQEKRFVNEVKILKDNKLLSPEGIEKLEELYQEIRSVDFGQASLLHQDIHSTHVFVTGDKITGVIDLGRLGAGDPRYDIAMSLMFQKPKQQQSFKKGYGGDLVNDPLVDKYLLTIAAKKVGFRFNNGLGEASGTAAAVFEETFNRLQ